MTCLVTLFVRKLQVCQNWPFLAFSLTFVSSKCKRSSLRSQCFMSTKTHNFAYCVLLSCPYWNSICVLVFFVSLDGAYEWWHCSIQEVKGIFSKSKVEQQNSISFLVCSLFIQCLLKVENMLSSQVTLLILGFCTGPKKWSHTFMSLLTTTKNPKRDKFIDINFFQHDGISKRFCCKIDNGRLNPF